MTYLSSPDWHASPYLKADMYLPEPYCETEAASQEAAFGPFRASRPLRALSDLCAKQTQLDFHVQVIPVFAVLTKLVRHAPDFFRGVVGFLH